MKKIMSITLFLCAIYMSAQDGLRLGLNAGIPLGSRGDFASFVANIDIEYDWAVSETVAAGIGTGVTVYSGKDMFADFKYLPVMASADVSLSDAFSLGGDAGYGISLESGIDGAFTYRFLARYMLSEHFDVTGRFNAFAGNGGTLTNTSIGLGYRF